MAHSSRFLEISGKISGLLPRNAPMTKELVNSLIGLPCLDCDGKQIGVVDRVDMENDIFYARILVADSIYNEWDEKYSMYIKPEDTICKNSC